MKPLYFDGTVEIQAKAVCREAKNFSPKAATFFCGVLEASENQTYEWFFPRSKTHLHPKLYHWANQQIGLVWIVGRN